MIKVKDEISDEEYDELQKHARRMRKSMTVHERILWFQFLRKFPVRFVRQKVLYHYIVDFYCAKAKLIIEVDGVQHSEEQNTAYDAQRTAFLRTKGYEVMRFSNLEIQTQLQTVKAEIKKRLEEKLGIEIEEE
ncbi:MAG: DUF559 domain-containing protein [Acidaminococcus sp.]|jgi:very-short-patch-repair endonuclease|nr:DUF559 domain-containing protein [Acidaminococcus sp.]MCI2101076.1 DUF559 domain-containing protein [Acidaminococcus sp.]MCI2115473.1 DUF559 domain-containing protein [Acidaminococcus sp.]MCI2117603.1 DUF559 domain-containing protein [Acidaminococcus sp.]